MDDEGLVAEVHAAMRGLDQAGLDREEQRDVILGMMVRWAAAGDGLPPERRTAEAYAREFAAALALAIDTGVFRGVQASH